MKPDVVVTAPEQPDHTSFLCSLLGHRAANTKRCSCLKERLPEDGSQVHVRHILSCFFFSHNYMRLIERHGHHEYVCSECGHQLLLSSAVDAFASTISFSKRPRYRCSVFGHRVHAIAERSAMVEYVCHCGHSFLKRKQGLTFITHPLTCTVTGHLGRFLGRRHSWAEYVCRVCGHSFCYTSGRTA